MSEPARPLHQILAERTALVVEVTALNSAQLRNSQLAGAIEIELLSSRRALEANGDSEEARNALEEAEARAARTQAELARCEAQLHALDLRLLELDRELARA